MTELLDAETTEPGPPVALADALRRAVTRTVRGKDDAVDLALVALLSGSHLLVEDLPGTGKTLLAKSLATAIGGRFRRIQCTPDLLPTDITGTSIFRPGAGDWEFRAGPLFANVVLVDEVNRASPRTQAALLEPMEEHQVTVDGATRALPVPFFCIATQNPYGQVGTFPLPESQLDRFGLVLTMGLPDREAERDILVGRGGTEVYEQQQPVTDPATVAAAIGAVRRVFVAGPAYEYVLDLAAATRQHPDVAVGASPRASVGLLHAAQAHAVVAGRGHVVPEDVQAVVGAAFAHRIAVRTAGPVGAPGSSSALGAGESAAAARVVAEIVERTPVPRP